MNKLSGRTIANPEMISTVFKLALSQIVGKRLTYWHLILGKTCNHTPQCHNEATEQRQAKGRLALPGGWPFLPLRFLERVRNRTLRNREHRFKRIHKSLG